VRIAAFVQAVNDAVIPIRIRHQLRERIAELQKIARQHEKQSAAASGDAVMDKVKSMHANAPKISGVTVVVGEVPAAPVDALRGAVDWVRQKSPSSAVLLAMIDDNRVTLLAGMSKDVVDKGVKAGDLIKEISPLVGGKGGGRPDMAQGGGTDATGMTAAIDLARNWITAKLS
jgi:alanyl-tRNA synthetase